MIKPNLIDPHDWHIQPSCQRSFRTVRLSGAPLDRGPDPKAWLSSKLDALLVFQAITFSGRGQQACRFPKTPLTTFASIFARTFRKYRTSTPKSSWNPVSSPGSSFGYHAAQSIKEQPAQNACATQAHEKFFSSRVIAMACSLRGSLQGFSGATNATHLTLRTGFPLPSSGRPIQATGRLHCFLTATFREYHRVPCFATYNGQENLLLAALGCGLLRIPTTPPQHNPTTPVKIPVFCGKRALPRAITSRYGAFSNTSRCSPSP